MRVVYVARYIQLVTQQAIAMSSVCSYRQVTFTACMQQLPSQLACARSIVNSQLCSYQLQSLIAECMFLVVCSLVHCLASKSHSLPTSEEQLSIVAMSQLHMTKLTCSTLHIKCGVIYDTVKCLSHQIQCDYHLHRVKYYTISVVCTLNSMFTVKQNYKST